MVFDFLYPLALLMILPVTGIIVGIFIKYKGQRSRKGLTPLVLRLIIALLLILSLAGMELKTLVDDTEIIFVADLSDSTLSKQKDVSEFIISSLDILPDKHQVGIVGFGADALVEQMVSSERGFYQFHSIPNTNYSNIDSALQRAESLFSSSGRKRIVVITDGAENLGDGMMRANALGQRGIRVDGVYLDTMPAKEVQLTSLGLPTTLYQGENYGVRVEIDSTVETQGILRLYADRRPVGTQQVEIQKGKNVFLFQETAADTGTIVYEAELEVPDDTFQQNNRMASYVRIDGPPMVALVEGLEGEGRELAKIMEAGGLGYKMFTPHTLPNQLEELVKYDAVILSNVDYDELNEEKVNILDTYVKSMGRGLLVTGGENSYALGGYLGTQLEKILPVDMDLSNKKDLPSLALMLVIDKSGSMSDSQYGIAKIDLAKEAAIRSVEALRETDYIGVIGFDSAASWIVDTQQVVNREEIQDVIGTVRSGGGTNLYPGMKLAFDSLKETDAALKHVIVLTDGHTAGGDFDGLLKDMTDIGITVSGVAVGADSDIALMENLSKLGNGRFYFTDEFASIPKIFTKETYMATRSYINNETFYPKALGSSPILENIQAVPPLNGYITTTAKGGANTVLVSNNDDPILAQWDYGLGKVTAWTSDARGLWTEDWLQWTEAPTFWLNTISSVLPGGSEESGRIETDRTGNQGQVTVSMDELLDEGLNTSAIIVDPTGKEIKIDMYPSKPGYYQGNFDLEETGVYLVRVEQQQNEGAVNVMEAGLVYPYSPEYDIRKTSSKAVLEQIVSQTEGRILEKPKDLLLDELPPVWKHSEIWPILLFLSLLLFIFDIISRKLGMNIIYDKLLLPVKKLLLSNMIKMKSAGNVKLEKIVTEKTSDMTSYKTIDMATDKADVIPTSKRELKNKSSDPVQENFTGDLLKARKNNRIRK